MNVKDSSPRVAENQSKLTQVAVHISSFISRSTALHI